VEGQRLVVGGDIILAVQGVTVTSDEDRQQARTVLEALRPGDILRITVLRDNKVQELTMKWPGR
jgi:S1-C subfamily serine protease